MLKKTPIKICLGLLFLLMTVVAGCGSTVNAPNEEGKSPMIKNEGSSLSPAESGGVSMRALWTITAYKVGDNALWGEKEARAILFKPLDITANAITFDSKTCRDVSFKKEMLKTKDYLASAFQTTPEALSIAEEVVEVVKTNCDIPGFGQYLRLKDRRLVIYLNGVFFYFEPNVNY